MIFRPHGHAPEHADMLEPLVRLVQGVRSKRLQHVWARVDDSYQLGQSLASAVEALARLPWERGVQQEAQHEGDEVRGLDRLEACQRPLDLAHDVEGEVFELGQGRVWVAHPLLRIKGVQQRSDALDV